jgi:hypothetical protein
LGALLVYVSGQGGDPGLGMAIVVTLGFCALLLALLFLAAGYWAEGRRIISGTTVVGVLLAASLAVHIGTLDTLSSPLTQMIGDPQVYAGPAGWLIGCAPRAATVEQEAVIEDTVVAEKEVEKVVQETAIVEMEKEVTRVVEREAPQGVAETPAVKEPRIATPTQAPQATPTVVPAEPEARAATPPAPPPPLLGQYIPETIYWMPEAVTDSAGHLALDIPLPDTPATWRLTALASTLQGHLGSAQMALPVHR